jgi:hypothetical protein
MRLRKTFLTDVEILRVARISFQRDTLALRRHRLLLTEMI